MKTLLGLFFSIFLLSACTQYQYQPESNPGQWKGRNIADLQNSWGMADQTFVGRDGSGVYLYANKSTANFFRSTRTNFGEGDTGDMMGQYSASSLMCFTVFQTNASGIITAVTRKGNNCGGVWVPKAQGSVIH